MNVFDWKLQMTNIINSKYHSENAVDDFMLNIGNVLMMKDRKDIDLVKSSIIKSLRNKDLRVLSYHNDIDAYSKDMNEIIPNCLPFKTMLIIPDMPTLIPIMDDKENLICTHIILWTFIHEVTLGYYFVCYSKCSVSPTNNKITSPEMISATVVLEDMSKINLETMSICMPKTVSISEAFRELLGYTMSQIFYHLNYALYNAKRDTCHYLSTSYTGKVQYRNFANKKIGQKIYVDEILYVGKKSELSNANLIKHFGIKHKLNHACEVMGHWRILPERCKIGHDRDGKEITDITWVKPFVRGEGDLIIKNRYINKVEKETV